MQKLIIALACLLQLSARAQTDTTKWMRAFPITGYMVDLDDSTRLVQLEMPEQLRLQEKQLGIVYGVYTGSKEDVVEKGFGRCNLIKANYYYFTIGHNKSGRALKEGDLLYVIMDKPAVYTAQLVKLAAHFIRLQDVYETPYYDRYHIFSNWTKEDESRVVDSMIADIQFTGRYFLENNPSMDVAIKSGKYKDQKTFQVMTACTRADLLDFFDYMIARPRLYAGRDWKIAEVFAWLSEGAPTVVKD